MQEPNNEFRKLTRMIHDKLWLEQSFGIEDGFDITWPTKPTQKRPAFIPPPKPVHRVLKEPVTSTISNKRSLDVQTSQGSFDLDLFLKSNKNLTKIQRLELLAEKTKRCTQCILSKGRKNVVFGEGNPDAQLMMIGEGPGYDEDRLGRPFVGKAGQLLDRIIHAIEMKREEVYIANIVKCRPPGNRIPDPKESLECMPYLQAQIEIVQPKVICLLGATAVKALAKKTGGIIRLRGKWLEFKGIPMMPTYHPAYLLRDESKKKECWMDMQQVRDKVRELEG